MPIFKIIATEDKTSANIRKEDGKKVASISFRNGNLEISVTSNKSLEDILKIAKIKRTLPPVKALISIELPK